MKKTKIRFGVVVLSVSMLATLVFYGSSGLMASTKSGATMSSVAEKQKIRVGVYKGRAIAVAFAASKYNTRVAKYLKQKKKAEAENDQELLKKLKVLGNKHQEKLHRQGFGNAPVDDLLKHVKQDLPRVLKKRNIELIVDRVITTSPQVELVDVTDELVQLFDPSQKTLKHIKELLKHPPVNFD